MDWEWVLLHMERHGCTIEALHLSPPVTLADVEAVQQSLGIIFPRDYVEVVTGYASKVRLHWHTKKKNFPSPYGGIFSSWADALWDFGSFEKLWETYRYTAEGFPLDEDDDDHTYWAGYNAFWHGKIPLIEVPNGDIIALASDPFGGDSPVLYLSHDFCDLHGKTLAPSFREFITRWSHVGCVGPEEWQMAPFYNWDEESLFASGAAVDQWRELVTSDKPFQDE